jgi:pyruvate,orthophosphate dikinase
MELAVNSVRAVNPKIKLGVCGEHGGDPESIEFFTSLGIDYVSCSPFRLAAAQLAAAQAHGARANRGGTVAEKASSESKGIAEEELQLDVAA